MSYTYVKYLTNSQKGFFFSTMELILFEINTFQGKTSCAVLIHESKV